MHEFLLHHLADAALEVELGASTAADFRSVAHHLARLAEYDRRQLYLPAGYPSMFRYCVDRLGLSEDVALQRIRAGRVALRHPTSFELLAAGRLNLTTLLLVAPHLTRENAVELLGAAARQSIKQVRRLLAERFGRIPELATPAPAAVEGDADHVFTRAGAGAAAPPVADIAAPAEVVAPAGARSDAGTTTELVLKRAAPSRDQAVQRIEEPESRPAEQPRRARVSPVGPGAFELVAILGQEAHDQLVASQELLGHALAPRDLVAVLERAIALQYERLRKRRCGATDRPRAARAERADSPRHIPAAVRREVWERDAGCCAFVSADGHRCGSREQIEIDHVVPKARGGTSTADNLRLVCRAHNRHLAERAFGRDHVRGRIETASRRRAEERRAKAAERARAEARRAALARQDAELGDALRALGYRGFALQRALAYCVDRAGELVEVRLAHACARVAVCSQTLTQRTFPKSTGLEQPPRPNEPNVCREGEGSPGT